MSGFVESKAAGVVAALAAPFVMTLGFLLWEDHWKGSAFALNLFKCSTASVGFLLLSLTVPFQRGDDDSRDGSLFPRDVFTSRVVGFLFLSSAIGIIIGDWMWLQALQLLGSKRVILIDSLKPFLAALFGWLLLDEQLRPEAFGGIALTVAGIVIVSFDQDATSTTVEPGEKTAQNESVDHVVASGMVVNDDPNSFTPVENGTKAGIDADVKAKAAGLQSLLLGFGLAFLNVVLDTYGSVLTKQYGARLTVWEINLLRFGFAAIIMQLVSALITLYDFAVGKELPSDEDIQKPSRWYSLPLQEMNRIDWLKVSGGVTLVTFAAPALSNYALFQIALALALTLGSVGPLYQIPLSYFIQKHIPTRRSIFGALCAVAGVAILAFRGESPEAESRY
jgi:drug/metabolite transporter (DMT)-like permease